ncbi:MAG TPA: Scr1 family TA system antitoxin-like transcriptional regulator [Amycolatopsis sp.]|uniref:Scr1 family TA system antitoxin-like transcriptional regulator n=1 Tax=Amycolatopsis nalaikhensis TaxID=715472 RepID=A0ABY8Y1N3_9PSEU|nr:Scr1 family TA system antitoxin-like transcriptional regulator [Amycolatopsis sp. 2-2]WIV61821.1 Scr1 family TA system antitoxin-like transcriptional regulator [Amycolatopsis sp. 2-2]
MHRVIIAPRGTVVDVGRSVVAPHTSPVVATWELALRLRDCRERRGIDVSTITRELGFTRNYWSAVENERKVLTVENLRKVIDLFGIGEDEGRRLLSLREAAKERGWWSDYSKLLNTEVQRMLGFEYGAQGVRDYESLLIPGLLQTPDYARAVIEPAVVVRPDEIQQRVDIRMRRQARLGGDEPLRLTAVLSEAALRQRIGGAHVLRDQLEHLERLILERRKTISVRVVPFTAPACGLFGAPTVHLIDFDKPALPTLAWQETVSTFSIISDEARVRDISRTYSDAREQALDEFETLELVRQCARDLPAGRA